MRKIVVLLISCMAVLELHAGIQVVTTAKTNAQTGSITTHVVFTRDGQTNLVRDTTTKAGVVQARVHYFYHDDFWIGSYFTLTNASGFSSQPNAPYFMHIDFDAHGKVDCAAISTTNGDQIETFTYTNGLFVPVN